MKKYLLLLCISITACKPYPTKTSEKENIDKILNNWHKAAAEVRYDDYFDALTSDAIYIGTDAAENWNKTEFQAFSKPYFDKGKAWSFTALERNIFFSEDGNLAYFDELLDTQMKLCRGSGVLVKTNNGWKIKHYVLSMTIPNETTDDVVKLKAPFENKIIQTKK